MSDHRQIIAAILAGDVGLAANRARRHLHGPARAGEIRSCG